MIRRITLAALFAAVALSSTGCCGTIRNFVYRIRHCNGCYPGYGGYSADAIASPSYALPLASPGYAMPVGDAGSIMGAPGCSSCGGGMPGYGASAVPMVPSYAAPQGGTAYTGPIPSAAGSMASGR